MCIPNIHVDANMGISFASFLVVMSFLSRSHRLSWFNQRGRRQPAHIQKQKKKKKKKKKKSKATKKIVSTRFSLFGRQWAVLIFFFFQSL